MSPGPIPAEKLHQLPPQAKAAVSPQSTGNTPKFESNSARAQDLTRTDKPESRPADWPKPEYRFKAKDLTIWPFLSDLLKDLRRPLTPEEQKLLGLTGAESAAIYSWLLSAPFAIEGLGGHPDWTQVPDYAKSLHRLSPGGSEFLDLLSFGFGRSVDKYLASELFGARWKGHLASLLSLGLLGQGVYAGALAIKDSASPPATPRGEMAPEPWSRYGAKYWSTVISMVFGPLLTTAEDFDRGPLLAPTSRTLGDAPFAGRQPFSGAMIEGNKGVGDEGGSQLKFAFTANLGRMLAPRFFDISQEDVDDPAKYKGPHLTPWISGEWLRPTKTMGKLGQLPFETLAGGLRYGVGRHRFLFEEGKRSREGQETLKYDKLAYAYKVSKDESVGLAGTVTNWEGSDIFAPGRGQNDPKGGQALQLTPFLRLHFGDRTRFGFNVSGTLITSSLESIGLSDARLDLEFIHRGDRSPGQLPLVRVQLTAVARRLNPLDPKSPWVPGGELKLHAGKVFAGGQFLTTTGEGIPRWWAAQLGAGVTPERAWTLLGNFGYLF